MRRACASSGALLRAAVARSPRACAPSRSLFVKIETTPNPDSLKFLPEDRAVLPEALGSGMHFADAGDARGSKLVRQLLKVKEITGVFLGRDFISVNKVEAVSWTALKPIVLHRIMDAYAELDASGTPIVEAAPASAPDTAPSAEDSEVVALIKELLETRIRPAVQEDGGDILYVGFDVDSGTVRVRMAGSCVGCPSSAATLRNGVENMLCHYIPEVKAVEQVTTPAEEEGARELTRLEQRLRDAGVEGV